MVAKETAHTLPLLAGAWRRRYIDGITPIWPAIAIVANSRAKPFCELTNVNASTPNLAVHLGRLSLANPIMVASGTFGYAREMAGLVDLKRLGAIVPKTITAQPRAGNAPWRTIETPAGMLNSIGLDNDGIEAFITHHLPYLGTLGTAIIVSIAGHDYEEFVSMAARLDGLPGIAAIELNVSCPNVSGGVDFGADPTMCRTVVSGVRAACNLPIAKPTTLQSGNLLVQFTYHQDRWQHTIGILQNNQFTPILQSLEGTSDEIWPASPPLQELHFEQQADQPVALLVGHGAKNHWSMSVEAEPAESRLVFDVACRVTNAPALGSLGSAYRSLIGNPIITATLGPTGEKAYETTLIEQPGFTLRGIGRMQMDQPQQSQICIKPLMEVAPILPSTIRWRYCLSHHETHNVNPHAF